MPQMPSMPEISGMPQMPSIGGGFYKPEIPNVKNQNTKKGDGKTDSEKSESVISSNNSTDNFVANLLGSNANLTAQDISSLYDFGLFDDISSLTANANINSGTNVSTNVLLQQVLTSLEELKQENKIMEEAIEFLESLGLIESLKPELKTVAIARKEYPSDTLNELSERLNLSKSCLNHRLRKLVSIAKEKGVE